MHIGIYVFDPVEVLDFAGPYEVFTTAARVHGRSQPGVPLFEVCTIAAGHAPVTARAGLPVLPDCTIADHPPLDVLIIPGGVVTAELARPEVIEWIARQAGQVQTLASVCTGAFLLAQAGVLRGRAVTTHWEDTADLRAMFAGLEVREGLRWVDEGAVVSSAGISAGIDMCLHLVERLAGRALAECTARQLEFDWTENGGRPAS
ncbi:DJ-1/PfpI family protein [Uliginosibacterium sp. 31-16]|uniref:DJ-1/PfpI family protein n=1 Tax=Uliginosibacterium sp. 31-16 TaxID=3068315 RepID=UPI00273D83A9|nr:DJ-1/PfpI family protein [Uliginosibacterium sp. 31-16]MDP5239345.1 DJ-1/PfpI family protein [Uliginosibacterium sp. 31-16]